MAEVSANKIWVSLFSAIGFGLLAALLTVFYIKNREAAFLASLEGEDEIMLEVVVINQDLLEGTRISEDMLSLLQIPADIAPDTVLTYSNYQGYIGRFLTHDISKGKPLTAQDLNETYPADFSDVIEQGKRGFTLQVDELNSISGLIRPGNYVDIYVFIETHITGYKTGTAAENRVQSGIASAAIEAASGGQLPLGLDSIPSLDPQQLQRLVSTQEQPKEIIIPVAQDIRVLATGQDAYENYLDQYQLPQRRTDDSFSAMTLDVSPKQAALLAIAADKGALVVTLRNRNDRNLVDFSAVTPLDLIKEAKKARRLAELKKAAQAAGASIDENGNWVTADGQVIQGDNIVLNKNGAVTTRSGELLGGNGLVLNENGDYVDEQGNIVHLNDIVLGPDGKITSKHALMKQAGYILNADGTYTSPNGVVVNPEDIVIGPNGKITTKQEMLQAAGLQPVDISSEEGKEAVLRAAGYRKNSDGTFTGPNGEIVDPNDIKLVGGNVVTPDGTILAKAGAFIDKDGNLVHADDVKVLANGSVIGPDGKTLSGPHVKKNKHGFLIDENGNIMTADGKILKGVTLDKDGNVLGPDGKVMTDAHLTVDPSGLVRDSSGKIIQGIQGSNEVSYGEDSMEAKLKHLLDSNSSIRLIIGGKSKNGKATTVTLPVEKLQQEAMEVSVE